MRDYAKGYLRNKRGRATATVSELEPNTHYEFEISSYCENYCAASQGREVFLTRLNPRQKFG